MPKIMVANLSKPSQRVTVHGAKKTQPCTINKYFVFLLRVKCPRSAHTRVSEVAPPTFNYHVFTRSARGNSLTFI